MRSNAPAMFQPCVGSQTKKRDINPVGLSLAEEFILNPAVTTSTTYDTITPSDTITTS